VHVSLSHPLPLASAAEKGGERYVGRLARLTTENYQMIRVPVCDGMIATTVCFIIAAQRSDETGAELAFWLLLAITPAHFMK
jgi:hypothetical protein